MGLGLVLLSFISAYLVFKFIVFLIQHTQKRRQFAHFPQLPTNFLLGETSFFKKNPVNHFLIQRLNEIAESCKTADRIFIAWMTILPTIFVYNKEYVKQILSRNEPDYVNKGDWLYDGIDDIVPNSLLTVKGDQWKIRRKLLSQPLHTTNFDNFAKIANFESKRLVNFLKKNPCKDTVHEMKKLTLIIFCKLLFEYDVSDEIEDAIKLANKTTDILVRKAFSLFLISPALYRFTPLASEESKMLKDLMNFKNKMLNAKTDASRESLKTKLENKNDVDSKSSNLTLIEILLQNFKNTINEKTAQWAGFTMEEIRAQLDTFIIAGFDTLSAAFTFLFYHLAKYPHYQEQIFNEIQQVVGNDLKEELTIEKVKQLVLLEAFINESLRIQPIAPLISRSIQQDIEFGNGKYKIPAKTDIVIFIERVLNDPEYFPEPQVFKPERFLEDQRDNLYVNIPFSGGARNCVAKRMALHTLAFVAAEVLRHYKIDFAPSTPRELTKPMIKFELVNKPIDELELKFIERR